MEYPDKNGQDLSARVADIEKCIGDIWAVIEAFQAAAAPIPGPVCPPYCGHEITADYLDDMKVEQRIAEICKYIADYGNVFTAMMKALPPPGEGPTCPPYCGYYRKLGPGKSSN